MLVEIKDLNKYYNKKSDNSLHVLKDISFKLEKNKFVSMMGTSGVGKSTLLNIIGCIETYDSGKYYFNGKEIKNIDEIDENEIRGKQISFVYQDYMLVEEDTAIDNVKIPLYFDKKFKKHDINKMAIEALKRVGLSEHTFNKKCSMLSGGQKQRVAIARAIVNKPSLILADEPTGALDEKTSQEILELFRSLISEDLSIIMVTHDKNVAEFSDEIFVMVDGKFVQSHKNV